MPDAASSPTAAFYAWEIRGRGWQAFGYPVALEPAFRPFPGHARPRRPQADDGRRETPLSALISRLFGRPERVEPLEELPPAPEPEPEPEPSQEDTPLLSGVN